MRSVVDEAPCKECGLIYKHSLTCPFGDGKYNSADVVDAHRGTSQLVADWITEIKARQQMRTDHDAKYNTTRLQFQVGIDYLLSALEAAQRQIARLNSCPWCGAEMERIPSEGGDELGCTSDKCLSQGIGVWCYAASLRELLAASEAHRRRLQCILTGWQQHIERMGKLLGCIGIDEAVEAKTTELRARLVEVEAERDKYFERVQMLTDDVETARNSVLDEAIERVKAIPFDKDRSAYADAVAALESLKGETK